jgi:aldose 1-epimerase
VKTSEAIFAVMPDGRRVSELTVENSIGMSFKAITYGAAITSVRIPDKQGVVENVTLGVDTLDEYRRKPMYLGAIVGRFANRIARGRFLLDGLEYSLACNDRQKSAPDAAPNHLHGGITGFDKVLWSAKIFREKRSAGIRWTYTSRDGEEGYPGSLKVMASYALTESGELIFEYRAVTDAPTPVNITNHAYWNLGGEGAGTVHDHQISFRCPFYLPVDIGLIPTGEILKTAGTPFDFSELKPIGRDIAKVPGGYDHCLVIGKPAGAFGRACTVRDPRSGRAMEVWTTEPGIQFYTGNSLDGEPFPPHGAFCLETQHFPDSVNIGHFPSCILEPGRIYHHKTVHKFLF